MISTTARRAASKTPINTFPTTSNTNLHASATRALSCCTHQRRHSSSKPSSPANGSKRVAQAQDLPTEPDGSKADGDKKSSSAKTTEKDGSGRKSKSAASLAAVSKALQGKVESSQSTVSRQQDAAIRKLPRVPSTGASLSEIYTASFFAGHRPITPTAAFPSQVTDEQFQSILNPTSTLSETAETIADLTKTFQRINFVKNVESLGASPAWGENDADGIRAMLADRPFQSAQPVQHLDGEPQARSSSLATQLFRPPPSSWLGLGRRSQNESPVTRIREYKSNVVIKEYVRADGKITTTYAATPITLQHDTNRHAHREYQKTLGSPSSHFERTYSPSIHRRAMIQHWRATEDRLAAQGWSSVLGFLRKGMYEVISVKRIRKAKIKKKKYKNLQKKTRTLRRKVERG